ncbi:hypothetical protein DKX38_024917 [Salix brachista]|uniref:Ubiquitin-like domain-containing protein n=1 Tax=Salix brachista TaxID=2182728 RepID=A0A5N5JMN2_9ROSI|nr:hypothetical protein DKX38_024917 [Salix brachista]
MEVEGQDTAINITVKFSGRSIPISVSLDSKIKDLKSLLQPLTNVLPRGQKLIFKGKLLVDGMILRESEVTNGAKEGPILKDAKTRPISRANTSINKTVNEKFEVLIDKNRVERWKVTGVIGLADSNLKAIPEEVWACGPSTRALDISNNFILDVPAQIGCLSSMQKCLLNGNGMLDNCINWKGLTSLKHLKVLSVSHNNLSTLPSELGALCSLRQLDVSNNKLSSLPVEIGLLTQLEVLKVNNNRISNIPMCIGDCISLAEVDLSSNLLTELPVTFGDLLNLKALHLSNNGLKSLPSTIFKMCLQLSTLDLHNTEITMDLEGWQDFDDRRRSKHQKQLDFRVVGSAEFDEGADKL